MLLLRISSFILFLFFNVNSSGQGIKSLVHIKIQSGHLNMRKEPSKDAAIVGKIPMDEYVHFLMEHQDGWVKVKYVYEKSGDQMESIIGWVHSDFVESPMLKSRFLDRSKEDEEGGLVALQSVYGQVMELGQDNVAFIVVDGKEITLSSSDDSPNVFKGSGFVIEPILFNTDSGYEWSAYTGFLRIQKGVETEYIFVTGSFAL
jgi:Bacterial SH3 domain